MCRYVRHHQYRFFVKYLVPLLALFSVSNTAVAQGNILEEVVVTARKRAENLQETPLSVMAFTGEDLEKQNINNITDLAIKMPNVNIGGSGGLGNSNADFNIRGLGNGRNAITREPAVALYIDDVYYGRSDGALLNVVDVERIEVLRGPQGTLFGRNATGGAIRYVTAKPAHEFEGKAQLTGGSYSRIDFKGMVNLPLSEVAALRLSGAVLTRDGFIDNVAGGKDPGDINNKVLRGQFRWDATPDLEALATADYSKTKTNGAASILVGIVKATPPAPPFSRGPPGAGFFPALEAIAAGLDASTIPLNDFENTRASAANFNNTESIGLGLTLTWDIGPVTLKSVTAYRDIDIHLAYDTDGTFASLFEQNAMRDLKMVSQEIQASGFAFDDRLDYVLGFFFYDEESSDIRDVRNGFNVSGNTDTRVVDPTEVKSYAGFAQGTFDLTDRFSITGGLRITHDKKSIFADELRNGVSRFGSATNEDKWTRLTGRISGEYRVTDDIFVFTSFARGFRAGGIDDRIRNGRLNKAILPYDEEILDTVEAGVRSELFDNKIRLNLTAFYGNLKDVQFSALVPNTAPPLAITQNGAKADIQGLEGEFIYLVNEFISIDGSFGLLDAEYKKLDPGINAITLDSEFPRAPDFSYALGAEMDIPMSAGNIFARLDWGWKDSYWYTDSDSTAGEIAQDSYGLLSARLSYEPDNSNWRVIFFATNLTDKEYGLGGLDLRRGTPLGMAQVEPGRPREFGGTVEYRF